MSSRHGGRRPASACRICWPRGCGICRAWAFYPIIDQPLWKWLSAFLGTLVTAGFAWLAWRAGRKWDKRCAKLDVAWRIGEPAAVLCVIAALAGLELFLERAVLFRERPGVATSVAIDAVRYLLLAWFVAAVIAGIGNAVVRLFASSAGSLDAALIRLCFRILSITGALLVLLHAAAEFGIGITPIIAGLGVGGLAVALAIRPTLENIMGGFVLFADKPVRVGEFCSFGDKMGTVEEIGLRSTRLRGLDRTVITVPNADFAQMQIVNFTRRDMNLFQCKIGLRYETTPDQLRYVAAKIRKLLIQHSKVSPDPARVRLSEFGEFGLRARGVRVRHGRGLERISGDQGGPEPADRRDRPRLGDQLRLPVADGLLHPRHRRRRRRAARRPRPRCASGGRRSGCRSPTTTSPSGPRWRTRCPSRPKARRTIGRALPRARRWASVRACRSAGAVGRRPSPRELA